MDNLYDFIKSQLDSGVDQDVIATCLTEAFNMAKADYTKEQAERLAHDKLEQEREHVRMGLVDRLNAAIDVDDFDYTTVAAALALAYLQANDDANQKEIDRLFARATANLADFVALITYGMMTDSTNEVGLTLNKSKEKVETKRAEPIGKTGPRTFESQFKVDRDAVEKFLKLLGV